jgi:acyl-CoA thioester hydrolase
MVFQIGMISTEVLLPMEHKLPVKVYYEDTDAQGIVYYANYLKYFERGRTEALESRGYLVADLDQEGIHFVVHEIHIKYHRAARLQEKLEVITKMSKVSDFRCTFQQEVRKQGEDKPLVSAEVHAVCLDNQGNLRELPAKLFEG